MFKLNKELSSTTADLDYDDVINAKTSLNKIGYYTPNPKLGFNEFTDEDMFSGISKFQKDNKLKVDGVIKPGGETEKKINEVREKKENESSLIDKMQAASTAGVQGLSFGFLDEANGVMKGSMYALGRLKSNWNKKMNHLKKLLKEDIKMEEEMFVKLWSKGKKIFLKQWL